MSKAIFSSRIQSLQQHIAPSEWLLISNPFDVFYYTGLDSAQSPEREAWLFVSADRALLCHTPFLTPMLSEAQLLATLNPQQITKELKKLSTTETLTVAVDAENITVAEQEALAQSFKLAKLDRSTIWKQRQQKSDLEIKAVRRAARQTAQIMDRVIGELEIGVTELELDRRIQALMLEKNMSVAFPSVIAFGDHSALPHHRPGSRALEKNMSVLIDMGAKSENYCSDMTRTVWFGNQPSPEFVKTESIVLSAYEAGVQAIQPSATAARIDEAARGGISKAGYGDQFIHTTGHGLGLEIHEPPSLYHTNQTPLTPGMILTIEPGIYFPGKFGYRHENTMLVTDNLPEVLT